MNLSCLPLGFKEHTLNYKKTGFTLTAHGPQRGNAL